jgi:iron complex outermembrane receptor protein
VLRHASLAPCESPSGLAIDIKNKKLFSACDNKMMAVTDIPTLKVVGAKLEHNDYTGFETEPTVRLIWAPRGSRPSVWAAASKAVRQPSRVDDNVQTNPESFPLSASSVEVLRLFGNPQVQAEQLRDYEVGYRSELTGTLSVDVATFLSFYHHLTPGSPTIVEIPLLYENQAHAMDYGGELFLTWKAGSHWRVSPGYSYLHALLRRDPSSTGQAIYDLATDFPSNMGPIPFPVDPLAITGVRSIAVLHRPPARREPSRATPVWISDYPGSLESVEMSLVGQNLLSPRTLEYGDSSGIVGAESVRSVYGRITWRFRTRN